METSAGSSFSHIFHNIKSMASSNSCPDQWPSSFRLFNDVLEPDVVLPPHNDYDPDRSPFTSCSPTIERCPTLPEAPTAPNRQDDPEWGLKYLASLTEVIKARDEYHGKLLKFYNFEKRFDPDACVCELWRRAHDSFQDIAIDLDTVVYNIKP